MESVDSVPCCRSASAHPAEIAGSTSCNPAGEKGHTVGVDADDALQRLRAEIPIHVAEGPHKASARLRAADSTQTPCGRTACEIRPVGVVQNPAQHPHALAGAGFPQRNHSLKLNLLVGARQVRREQAFRTKVANGDEVRGSLQPNVEILFSIALEGSNQRAKRIVPPKSRQLHASESLSSLTGCQKLRKVALRQRTCATEVAVTLRGNS